MTNGDVVFRMTELAHNYTPTAKESLLRNGHMHKVPDEQVHLLTDEQIKAVINDFVNFIAAHHGMDLGMYTSDFPNSHCKHGVTTGKCGPCDVEKNEKRSMTTGASSI